MTLTWLEISQRWPEADFAWDHSVGPDAGWHPRFEERGGVLWADDVEDRGKGWFFHHADCRCLVWADGAWISHKAWSIRQLNELSGRQELLFREAHEAMGISNQVWRREVLGEWVEPQRSFRDRVLEHVARLLDRRLDGVRDGVRYHVSSLIDEYAVYADRGTDRDVDRVGRWIAYRITQFEGRPNSNVLPI